MIKIGYFKAEALDMWNLTDLPEIHLHREAQVHFYWALSIYGEQSFWVFQGIGASWRGLSNRTFIVKHQAANSSFRSILCCHPRVFKSARGETVRTLFPGHAANPDVY